MPRTEIIAKRTATAKHFDNGDGTFTLEAHIRPIHHLKDGALVDTDYSLKDVLTEIKTGEFPIPISLNKTTRSITFTYPNGTITLSPVSSRNPNPTTMRSDGCVDLVGLWRNVTLTIGLVPMGLSFQYTPTASTGQVIVQWNVTDPNGIFASMFKPTQYESYSNGVWSIDLTTVPIGVTV